MIDEVWTSHLRIAGGNAVEEAPQLAYAERRDRRGRLIRLYLLAEAANAAGEAFVDAFVARIGETFDPTLRSLTGSLSDVLADRHEELRHWNREHLPVQQASYGVSCVLLREGEPGMLAQAGPSLAVLAGDPGAGAPRLIQVRSHRGEDPVAQPIGGAGALRVQFFPLPAAQDGWALLLTNNALRVVGEAGQIGLGQLDVDDVLPNLYPSLRDLNQAAALIVGLPPSAPRLLQGERPSEPAPEPPREPSADAAGEPVQIEIRPPPVESPPSPPPLLEPATEVFMTLPEPRSSWPSNPFAALELPLLTAAAGAAGSQPSAPSSWQRPLLNLGSNLPDPSAERPELEPARRRTPPFRTTLITLAAMLAALVAVAAVLLLPPLLARGDEQFNQYVESARQGLAAAALGVDVASSRSALQGALGDVNLALDQQPLDQQALDLRSEIEAALAELELLFVPTEFETLVELGRFGPSIALGAIRLAGDRLYALDDAGGRVFAISETGIAQVIFSEGAPLDDSGARRTARPISLAPYGAELWVLDSEGQLFRLMESDSLLVGLPGVERLGSLDAIAVSSAGLWLLDAAGGAVWLFPRVGPEQPALIEPRRVTPRVDLAAGGEIAVTPQADGATAILIALADGRLRRFIDGAERPLTLEGLDREPLVPASLGLGTQSGLLYLADRGNDRVLILGADGALSRQIAAEQLRGVRGVAVDEGRGRIIYAFESRLLSSPLLTGGS